MHRKPDGSKLLNCRIISETRPKLPAAFIRSTSKLTIFLHLESLSEAKTWVSFIAPETPRLRIC